MRAIRALWLVALVLGWGCDDKKSSPIDAPPQGDPVRDMCTAVPPGPMDFFGESCTEDPFPAVTVCHSDQGWCVACTCRPQCEPGCPRCNAGVVRVTDRGACYCSPE